MTIDEHPTLDIMYADTWNWYEYFIFDKIYPPGTREDAEPFEVIVKEDVDTEEKEVEKEDENGETYTETETIEHPYKIIDAYSGAIFRIEIHYVNEGAEPSVEKSKQFLGLLRNTEGKCTFNCFADETWKTNEPKALEECVLKAEFDRGGTNRFYRIPNIIKSEPALNKLKSGLSLLYAVLQSNTKGYIEGGTPQMGTNGIIDIYKEPRYRLKEDSESDYTSKLDYVVEHMRYLMEFPDEPEYEKIDWYDNSQQQEERDYRPFDPLIFEQIFGDGMSVLWHGQYTLEEFIAWVKAFKPPAYALEGYTKFFLNHAADFYNIATSYGLDPLFIFSIGLHESAYGTSSIANKKGNVFGWGAYDWDPSGNAWAWDTMEQALHDVCSGLKNGYVSEGRTTIEAIGKKYATDPNWANAVTRHMKGVLSQSGVSDINTIYPTKTSTGGDIPTSFGGGANSDILAAAAEITKHYNNMNAVYYSSANMTDANVVNSYNDPNINCASYVAVVLWKAGALSEDQLKGKSYISPYKMDVILGNNGWTNVGNNINNWKPGDVVSTGGSGHIMIYAGNGKFWDQNTCTPSGVRGDSPFSASYSGYHAWRSP